MVAIQMRQQMEIQKMQNERDRKLFQAETEKMVQQIKDKKE